VSKEPNIAPVVSAGSNQAYTVPHDGDLVTDTVLVTLNGYATTDTENYMSPDGKVKLVAKDDVLTYHWSCPTASVVSTDATTVVSMIHGAHVCTLTVTDTYGAGYWQTGQASAVITITVTKEPNTAPVADAGPDQTYTVPHDGRTFTNTVLVTLPGINSTDIENYMSFDGNVIWETKNDRLDYQWSCPTAGVSSSDVVTVVPMLAGVHICTLTVTDTYGAAYVHTGQSNDTTTITVNSEPNMGYSFSLDKQGHICSPDSSTVLNSCEGDDAAIAVSSRKRCTLAECETACKADATCAYMYYVAEYGRCKKAAACAGYAAQAGHHIYRKL